MTNLVIPEPKKTLIPVHGSDEFFPVRRVYCIGRNYAAHTIEMGFDPDKEPPFFFQKNTDNIDTSGQFPYPPESSDVHYELELVVALNKGGSNIKEEDAYDYIYGFGIGLDMTRRDLQGVCKKMGRPWEIGKAFERSAPMGSLTPMSEVGKMESGSIQLKVNDEVRQDGNLDMMLWKIPEQIAILSKFYDITAGDLIMTGTPAGVGPIVKGDKLVGTIDGLQTLNVEVV
jgi:fumarylpyruvate hydrolase|tara:strand:- start:1594 stop:2280 length:687 start_codon:yes stop_codon:yes gene_type:complete